MLGLLGGCSGGDDDPGQGDRVEQAVRETFAAYTAEDADGYLNGWTEKGIERTFGVPMHEAHHVPPSIGGVRSFHESTLDLRELSRVHVTGDRATVEARLIENHVIRTLGLSLVREDGKWLVDALRETASEPAENAQRVSVQLSEYRIGLRSSN